MKSFYLLVVVVILSACEAHRHHLDHHGRHHDGESRREHLKHHPNHDLKVTLADLATPKNETISIDVTRKETRPDNEKNTIRVTVELVFLFILLLAALSFHVARKHPAKRPMLSRQFSPFSREQFANRIETELRLSRTDCWIIESGRCRSVMLRSEYDKNNKYVILNLLTKYCGCFCY